MKNKCKICNRFLKSGDHGPVCSAQNSALFSKPFKNNRQKIEINDVNFLRKKTSKKIKEKDIKSKSMEKKSNDLLNKVKNSSYYENSPNDRDKDWQTHFMKANEYNFNNGILDQGLFELHFKNNKDNELYSPDINRSIKIDLEKNYKE